MKGIFILLASSLCILPEKICAQLEYIPPIHAEIKDKQNISGVLLMDTRDFRFGQGVPSLYPSTIQIIDPLHPWPPIFFANVNPGGEGLMGNGMFQNFQFQDAVRQLSFFLLDATTKNSRGIIIICDTNFMILDTVGRTGHKIEGHEFQVNSKGERLYLVEADTQLNLVTYTKNPADTSMVVTSQMIEITDKNDLVLFRWNPVKHIPITDSYKPFVDFDNYAFTNGWDWQHGNSLRFTYDGNIVYSFKYAGVGKINRKTGALMWKLGGKTPTIPVPPGGEYFRQHDFREVSPGIFSLYSNGDKKKNMSKAITYRIDEQGLSAKIVKVYEPLAPVFSIGFGNYETEKKGMHLFNYGKYLTPQDRQKIFEIVDSAGVVQAEYSSPSLNFPYRVQWVRSWNPAQPLIINESGILKISGKHTSVKWYRLDGERLINAGSGSTCQPWEKGTYLAVTKAGFGWLVSKPYEFK